MDTFSEEFAPDFEQEIGFDIVKFGRRVTVAASSAAKLTSDGQVKVEAQVADGHFATLTMTKEAWEILKKTGEFNIPSI